MVDVPDNINLREYIEMGGYKKLISDIASYSRVAKFLQQRFRHSIFIGIDGPSNSGKTSLADASLQLAHSLDLDVNILYADYFLIERERRNEIFKRIGAGEIKIEDYSKLGWNQEYMHSTLSKIKDIVSGRKGYSLKIPSVYDRLTGLADGEITLHIKPGSIVLVEGVGLHLYQSGMLDIKVRTDVSNADILYGRLLKREAQKPLERQLDTDYLKYRYDVVDVAHTAFLRRATLGVADYVLDTTQDDSMDFYDLEYY